MGLWALLLVPLAASVQINGVAVNIDERASRQQNFIPMVAFKCGYRNKYMSDEGEWVTDANRYATCQTGKLDILKYCKRAYPTLNITNLVEYSHEVAVDKWCREEGTPCKWSFTLRPFRCIVGQFLSEALQVPKGCEFSHVSGQNQCDDYTHWKNVATQQCLSKKTPMAVRSFAMLEPCGLDLFTGVEYVCCKNNDTLVEVKPVAKTQNKDKDDYDDTYDEDDDDDDDDDDSLSDEEKNEKQTPQQDVYFKTFDPEKEHTNFKEAMKRIDEHHKQRFMKIRREWANLEDRYKQMAIKDPKGSESFKNEMQSRYNNTIKSINEEHKKLRSQIEEFHEQRVQETLNEKKREATHSYREALALHVGSPNKHNVLTALKTYIRAEEKDRVHMLNRYRHLLRNDPVEAAKFREDLSHKLRYIDLRINGTIEMLHDFAELESQIRPIAEAFWHDLREENMPMVDMPEVTSLLNQAKKSAAGEVLKLKAKPTASTTTTTTPASVEENTKVLKDSEEDEDEYYEDEDDEEVKKIQKVPIKAEKQKVELKPKPISVEVDIDSAKILKSEGTQTDDDDDDDDSDDSDSDETFENIKQLRVDIEPIIEDSPLRDLHAIPAYYRKDKLVQDASSSSSFGSFIPSQITFLAGVAIFAVLILIFVVNNRQRRARAGFVEVDVCTPEERHLSGMQVNGYENPTYSFFDAKP